MEAAVGKRRGISGNTLKVIAIVSMLIDHIGACVLEIGMMGFPDMDKAVAFIGTETGRNWYLFDMALRAMGRLSFPIFCFLIVEGFLYTRDVKKYAARLLIFALISEIPFDYAVEETWFDPSSQNVYFTLFIGLLVLIGYAHYERKPIWQGMVILTGCIGALILKTDYDMTGIVLILIFYVFRDNKRYQAIAGGILCAVESLTTFGTGALSLIPIQMYNGTRGEKSLKYFFYWFYPVHLVALALVRQVIFR